MRSKAAVFWFVMSMFLGIALVVQWDAGRRKQQKLEALQVQVEKTASNKDAEAKVKELEAERLKLTGELRAAEYELNTVRLASAAGIGFTNAAAQNSPGQPGASGAQGKENPAGGMAKMLGNMMKDPEMRKAMAQQQRMGVDMIYGSLMKQLKLSPEQEEKFKDVLIEQQMEGMSQAGAMLEGSASDRAKVAQELAAKRAEKDEEIKKLLGEEKFEEYQNYNQTLGERMMLEQFGRSAEISPEQNNQLLAIMQEEKKNVQINLGTQQADPTQDWQAVLGSDEATQRLFMQQEEVNNRVMERAAQVLTPEQLEKFGPVLKSQLDMQKAGLKMAREMFGSGAEKPSGQSLPPADTAQ
jgi:hypothetical protein